MRGVTLTGFKNFTHQALSTITGGAGLILLLLKHQKLRHTYKILAKLSNHDKIIIN